MSRNVFGIKVLTLLSILFLAISSNAQTRYTRQSIHSPFTVAIVDRVKAIVAVGQTKGKNKKRFIKVGDSISSGIMGGMAFPFLAIGEDNNTPFRIRLADKTYLHDAIEYFRTETIQGSSLLSGDAALARVGNGTTCFDRSSIATWPSTGVGYPVTGTPCPVRLEMDTVHPSFATIMIGANDLGGWGDCYFNQMLLLDYLNRACDSLLYEGVVPIVRATCPKSRASGLKGIFSKDMDHTRAASYLVRAYCQQKKIPFIDEFRAFMRLPNWGLSDDFHHPANGGLDEVSFDSLHLEGGYTMQNFLIMQALNRCYQIVGQNMSSIDPEPVSLAGTGTAGDPFLMDEWPFVDARATSASHPAYYYKMVTTKSIAFRGMATHTASGVTPTYVLYNSGMTQIAANGEPDQPVVEMPLSAGTYFVKVGTFGTGYGEFQMLAQDSMDADTIAKVPFLPTPLSTVVSHNSYIPRSSLNSNFVATNLSVYTLSGRKKFSGDNVATPRSAVGSDYLSYFGFQQRGVSGHPN